MVDAKGQGKTCLVFSKALDQSEKEGVEVELAAGDCIACDARLLLLFTWSFLSVPPLMYQKPTLLIR
jgi:hypothetical protein